MKRYDNNQMQQQVTTWETQILNAVEMANAGKRLRNRYQDCTLEQIKCLMKAVYMIRENRFRSAYDYINQYVLVGGRESLVPWTIYNWLESIVLKD